MMEHKYIDQLTWLRGVAALFVIVSHTIQATSVSYLTIDTKLEQNFFYLFNLGSYGVVLFFALSGCTLYLSNADKVSTKGVKKFYIKRFFRIWPAYVVSLLFYIAFGIYFSSQYISPQDYWVEYQFLADYTITDILSYLALSFNFNGKVGLFNNAFWSLPVEFQYYLLFPLMIFFINRFSAISLLLLAIIFYFLPKTGVFPLQSFNFFTLAFSFVGGVFIGWFYKCYPRISLNKFVGLSSLVVVFLCVSLIQNSIIELPDIMFISNKWNWFGFFALVAVYLTLFTPMKIKCKPFATFLSYYGTISYSTYLYHNLILGIFVLLIIKYRIEPSIGLTGVVFLATVVITYFVASLSFQYVERPMIKMSHKLAG